VVVLDCELAMAGRDPMTSLDTVETSSPFYKETMMERISEQQAKDLISACTLRRIDAEAMNVEVITRESWDGVGYDIAYDAIIRWKRMRGFGTHAGVIRQSGWYPDGSADIFWGHYDLATEDEAIRDFDSRRGAS